MSNKRSFEIKLDDKVVKLDVRKPDFKKSQKAMYIRSKVYKEALENGAILRSNLDQHLRSQNMWSDEKQAKFDALQKVLLDGEKTLAKGRIKLLEAKDIAMKMRVARIDLATLGADRNRADLMTADAMAEDAYFNYLVSVCTVYSDSGTPYFASYEDYLEKGEDPVVGKAATELGKIIYGLDDDFEKKFPENKFLLKYGFVDDKLRLVNKEKKLVDSKGRLINEDGRFISQDGKFVDSEGNEVTEDGELRVEFAPFLDEEGKPVQETSDLKEEEVFISKG